MKDAFTAVAKAAPVTICSFTDDVNMTGKPAALIVALRELRIELT
jgi:hypothetical protein